MILHVVDVSSPTAAQQAVLWRGAWGIGRRSRVQMSFLLVEMSTSKASLERKWTQKQHIHGVYVIKDCWICPKTHDMPLILDSDFETICIELTSVSCMIYIYIERDMWYATCICHIWVFLLPCRLRCYIYNYIYMIIYTCSTYNIYYLYTC